MKTRTLSYLLIPLVCFLISCIDQSVEGLYSADTKDGITLKMRRYRPSVDARYRDGQPVLLFTGFAENLSEFIPHTSDDSRERYRDMTLEEPIASWAEGDEFIAEDPMLYYSFAHYLWNRGYDPWLANYRGAGRGAFKSSMRNSYVSLDVYAALDVPALVDKVISVTGKFPVIGGHSTGGLASYCYLQGVYYDIDELERGYENGYLPHVKSDPDIAMQRNNKVMGFIGIDPAGIVPLPDGINVPLLWDMMGRDLYLNLDFMMEKLINPYIMDLFGDSFLTAMDLTLKMVFFMDSKIGDYVYIFEMIGAWNIQNTDRHVEDFFWRNCFSGTYVRAAAQYYDWAMNNTMREHWRNGIENKDLRKGPTADQGNDNYHYYDQNMHLMSVPAISVLSEFDSMVQADQIIEDIMKAKTLHALDQWHIIPDTSHNDIVFGFTASEIAFPAIGTWLEQVCGEN